VGPLRTEGGNTPYRGFHKEPKKSLLAGTLAYLGGGSNRAEAMESAVRMPKQSKGKKNWRKLKYGDFHPAEKRLGRRNLLSGGADMQP